MTKPRKPANDEVRNSLLESRQVSQVDLNKVWPVLDEMLTLYYPPFDAASEEELLRQCIVSLRRYVAILGNYDIDTLNRGWSAVVENHKTRGWPVPGVIDAECHAVDPQRRTASGYLPGERRGYDPVRYPPKARPDFSYQIEKGLMTQEQADRYMRNLENPREETRERPDPRVLEIVAGIKNKLRSVDAKQED